jgi:hypothetical protein
MYAILGHPQQGGIDRRQKNNLSTVSSKRFGLHVKSNLSLSTENRDRGSQPLQHASLTSKYCHLTYVLTMQKRRIVQLHAQLISNASSVSHRRERGTDILSLLRRNGNFTVDLVLAMDKVTSGAVEKMKSGEGLVFLTLGRVP